MMMRNFLAKTLTAAFLLLSALGSDAQELLDSDSLLAANDSIVQELTFAHRTNLELQIPKSVNEKPE
jgi:hypothetical protein